MATTKILERILVGLSCLVVALACSGCVTYPCCVTYFGDDGPYEGRVIDQDTRQPILGAVVHGTWVKANFGPGGVTSTYYDSREVLTDANGDFSIPGQGVLIFSNVEEMMFTIFKAGYKQQGLCPWSGMLNNKYNKDIEFYNKRAIFKLKKLSIEQRKKTGVDLPSVPKENKKLFIIERNKEIKELGYPSNYLIPED